MLTVGTYSRLGLEIMLALRERVATLSDRIVICGPTWLDSAPEAYADDVAVYYELASKVMEQWNRKPCELALEVFA